MKSFSTRGETIPSSPIRKLAPLAVKAAAEGKKIYHLNIGQPDLPSPKKAIEAVRNISRETLEYSPSQGITPLREKMSGFYRRHDIDVDPDEIIVTTGGSEAVLFTFMAVLNPGDEVIITEPAYANYISFSMLSGAVVKPVTTRIEDGFALPPVEEIEKLIGPKTKALLICNPNNPTGYIYSPEEMEKIRQLVIRNDIFLIADEVYSDFNFSGREYVSAMHLKDIEQNVVMIDSMSKRYSECGIRIGAIVTKNERLRQIVMKFCQARLSPPLLGQIAAEASIEGTEEYSREVFEEYRERRDFFIKGLNAIPGVYSPQPQGAFYTIASLPVEDAEDFCKWCLTDFCYRDDEDPGTDAQGRPYTGETVMMAPAAGFYSTPGMGRNQARLAYVLKTESLARALKVLAKALEEYNAR